MTVFPDEKDLEGVFGSPFDVAFLLYQDKAKTAYPIIETVTFEINRLPVASEGNGITISDNRVDVHLTSDNTSHHESVSYRLVLTDHAGEPIYPVHGAIYFKMI